MAAGLGSRFGGLKQIEPIGPNGEFIIDYSIYDAIRAGFDKVVIVIKKDLEQAFRETIGKRIEDKINVVYAYQEIGDILESKRYLVEKRKKPWGTLQAVLAAKDVVEGDFVVINADDFYGHDAYFKASNFLSDSKNDREYACISYPCFVTASKFGSVKRGVCFLNGDNIEKIVESKIDLYDNYALAESLVDGEKFQIKLDTPVSMNMFVFKNNFFHYAEEYFEDFFKQSDEVVLDSEAFLPELVKLKIASGEIVLKNIVANSKWLGITYKEDLDELKTSINDLILKGEYPSSLWE